MKERNLFLPRDFFVELCDGKHRAKLAFHEFAWHRAMRSSDEY